MRTPEPETMDEREMLVLWLQFHRDALAFKCAGMEPEQMVLAACPPSDLTLLGLVRHLTEMERAYLVWAMGGGNLQWVYCGDDDPDADIVGVTPEMTESSMAAWRAERGHADRLIPDFALDQIGPGNGYSLRWNLVKLIQEYARHNGHADLIRQAIDGAVGE